MTQEDAIALGKTGWWKTLSPDLIVSFQLFEPLLCMPFGDFHGVVEKVLDRPVWTHEFADIKRLQAEFLGERPKPTMEEIVNQIPEAKRIIIQCPPKSEDNNA